VRPVEQVREALQVTLASPVQLDRLDSQECKVQILSVKDYLVIYCVIFIQIFLKQTFIFLTYIVSAWIIPLSTCTIRSLSLNVV